MTEKSHSAEAELSQANLSAQKAGKSETPIYEIGYHVVPTVSEDGVSAVVESVRKLLGDAEVISEQFPSKVTLAYTVERASQGKREKYTEGFFGFIKFAMDREMIEEVQAKLRVMREVLRFIVVETVREDAPAPRRAVFTSTRLEGETIQKPQTPTEKPAEVSQEELDKSIEALVS